MSVINKMITMKQDKITLILQAIKKDERVNLSSSSETHKQFLKGYAREQT